MIGAWLKYILQRVGPSGVHSPFVFDFCNNVLAKARDFDDEAISTLRPTLKKDRSVLEVRDFGAGSKSMLGNERTVHSIAAHSSVSPKFGKLLATIVRRYEIKSSIELGTSLGIGAAYLGSASENNKVVSFEGCPNTALLAVKNLKEIGLSNIQVTVGAFEELLKTEVSSDQKFDLIFIDGNHRLEPTLNYFHFFLNHSHDSSFLVFDDIHWSPEMEICWSQIVASPEVSVTMDLFRMGIAIKRKGQTKEHFVLKF